eukprot:gene3578-4881_t
MTARIIDGKAFAADLRDRIAAQVTIFRAAAGRMPGLAVVLVGEDPASAVYVRSKHKATLAAGMASFEYRLPADTPQEVLLDLVDTLNGDPAVDGILVQLPLPGHIEEQVVLTRIDPDKDVDGFHPVNAGRLATGLEGFVPCTPLGCVMLLKDVLGAAQLQLIGKPNQPHRAEIAKVLVHSSARRRGLGAALMQAAETAARQAKRDLLVAHRTAARQQGHARNQHERRHRSHPRALQHVTQSRAPRRCPPGWVVASASEVAADLCQRRIAAGFEVGHRQPQGTVGAHRPEQFKLNCVALAERSGRARAERALGLAGADLDASGDAALAVPEQAIIVPLHTMFA